MQRNSVIFVLVVIMLISFVSANGLVVQDGTLFLNKTVGIEKTFEFDLSNTDSFSFFNITFEDNSMVEMVKIPVLESGQLAHVTATIIGDEEFSGDIRIKGFYHAELGSSNETHHVNISYSSGLLPCAFSIIEGDSIFWDNNAGDVITLENSDTSVTITTILKDSNYSLTLSVPSILRYSVLWSPIGFPIGGVCDITILDSEGLIQNPDLDGILNIDLNVEYTPTTLNLTFFLIDEYNMNFYDTEEGVFLIKNNGSNPAKNIEIVANWFSFSPNNFDLNPGLSKTVSYSINPVIIYTNATNKTHTKDLTITGNFPTSIEEFEIFIKYADIDSGNYSEADNLLGIIEKFCEENPEICAGTPKIIYRGTNDSEVNVTIATGQLRKIFEYIYNQSENDREYQKNIKEMLYGFNQTVYSVEQSQNKSSQDIESLKSEFETSSSLSVFTVLGFSGIVIMGGGGFLTFHFWRKKKLKKLRTMS